MNLRATSLALTLLLLSGCGLKRLPPDLVSKLPYESKIELLEAENELALAIDHVDEAQSVVNRTRDAIRRAKDRYSAAKGEVSDAENDRAREVAELAVQEGDARVEYLRARQEVNVEHLDLMERALVCARARFELARVTVARKAKVEGAEAIEPKDFEEQAKSCEDAVAAKKLELAETEKKAGELKATWDKAKGELAKKTFDARASPYVE